MERTSYRILIIGGGTGGVSAAARLANMGYQNEIALIEPSHLHHYQPYWTLIATGQVDKQKSFKEQKKVIPRGVDWLKTSLRNVDPDAQCIITQEGRRLEYQVLLIAVGLELNFDKIKGARDSLGKNGVICAYRFDQLDAARDAIQGFHGGTAIFTMPPVPIKCAGAPQKIMYLADAVWRKNGVRADTNIIYATAGAGIFGIKEFAAPLLNVIQRKDISLRLQTELVEVRGEEKIAVFRVTNPIADEPPRSLDIPYDLLHLVPPMRAPKVIRESPLASTEAGQQGWLAVDKATLQHLRFKNIFGIGDVTGIPNSKTGAAIRKQAPVVAENIKRYLRNEDLLPHYNGYSSCPLITDIGKVILAEFGYDGKLLPSFPLDSTKERRLYWHLKKDLLPPLYWQGMLKGRL